MSQDRGYKLSRTLPGHSRTINRIAWSPKSWHLASASQDHMVNVWDVQERTLVQTLKGHFEAVNSVTWSPDGKRLASASRDQTIIIWNALEGTQHVVLKRHSRSVFTVAWSPDGLQLASGGTDGTVRLWDVRRGQQLGVLEGHGKAVNAVTWSPDGRFVASASEDHTVRLWETGSGRVYQIFEGHNGPVYCVVWSPDGNSLASCSADQTIRIWGTQVGIFEGHTDPVACVGFSRDGRLLASKSLDNTVRLWNCESWETIESVPEESSYHWTSGLAFHPQKDVLATLTDTDHQIRIWTLNAAALCSHKSYEQSVQYTNAKVALVGGSGVGKTQLASVLIGKNFMDGENASTHGVSISVFDNPQFMQGNGHHREIRETLLWDLAGQHVYRQVHLLHLKEVAVALVVFSAQSPTDSINEARYWSRALRQVQRAAQKRLGEGAKAVLMKKFLVAGRVDVARPGLNKHQINEMMEKLKFDRYFETSSREGWNIAQLKAAIQQAIDWDSLPRVSSPELFQHIKEFIARAKEQEYTLLSANDLYDLFITNTPGITITENLPAQFNTCINLMESRGLIRRFRFGDLILLKPELLDSYASSIVDAARNGEEGLGFIVEEDVAKVPLFMPSDKRISNEHDENLLLIATVEDLLDYEIALRDEQAEESNDDNMPVLVFPSELTRRRPHNIEPDKNMVTFDFEGAVSHIYARLAVRLWRSRHFDDKKLYQNTAVYITKEQRGKFHLFLDYLDEDEGQGKLTISFEGIFNEQLRYGLENYVYLHLEREALPNTVKRTQVVACPDCECVIPDKMIKARKERGHDTMTCPVCGATINLGRQDKSMSIYGYAAAMNIDRRADEQRQLEVATYTMKGKIATGYYDVFLSYTSRDEGMIRQIAEHLTARGIRYLPDEPGMDLPLEEQIELMIQQRKPAVIFLGNQGLIEAQQAILEGFRLQKCRVIPVLLPNFRKQIPLIPGIKRCIDLRQKDSDPLEQLIASISKRPIAG